MESTQNEATNVAQEVPSQAGTEAQAGVEVPKVDLGDSETFSRDQVQEIVNNALKSEIVGLKSNNQALKDEKKKAQDRIREYSDLLSGLGGEEGINQLQALKQKIDQDEELRLFTTGDREKYNDRILNRARQDHANQMKVIQEERDKWKGQTETFEKKYQLREIEKSIMDGCAESGVNPRYYKAMSAQVRDDIVFDNETDRVIVKDNDGSLRYGKDGQPMQVGELIDTLREEQPELFMQSTGGGAVGSTGSVRRYTGVSNDEIKSMSVGDYKKLREQGVIR
tara:strand:- start:764 stop:1606 length:843 start_codon:yes stop_codon:yes gene_type:complete